MVLVGVLILAGAQNTSIVGANGVLNRVAEDGVLTPAFQKPHPRYGTSYRIINLIVAMQLFTIIASRGNVYVSGGPLCVRRDLEFRPEVLGGIGPALSPSPETANGRSQAIFTSGGAKSRWD